MRSLSSSLATLRLMYSEPLSLCPPDDEGEGIHHGFWHRQQVSLADVLHRKDGLELGDLVHRVDEINAFDPVLIALMHAIHAQITGAAIWKGVAPLADADFGRSRLLERTAFGRVGPMLPQVVQVSAGNARQPREAGMRRSELLSLEWQNVKFNGALGSARLLDTKNGEERTVPLSSVAVTALRTLTRGIKGKVFKLTPAALNHKWRAARIAIGSPDLRVHDLRHEATSRLFEDKGFNVVEASAVTGHKSLQMLKRYANLNTDLLAQKLG